MRYQIKGNLAFLIEIRILYVANETSNSLSTLKTPDIPFFLLILTFQISIYYEKNIFFGYLQYLHSYHERFRYGFRWV